MAAHMMDFPGTTSIHWEHSIKCIVDIVAGLAFTAQEDRLT